MAGSRLSLARSVLPAAASVALVIACAGSARRPGGATMSAASSAPATYCASATRAITRSVRGLIGSDGAMVSVSADAFTFPVEPVSGRL